MPRLRLRIGSRTFAPGLVPTLVMLPVLALLLWLGTWQVHRAAEKRVLFEDFARGGDALVELPPPGSLAPRYARVRVTGTYLPGRQFLLDNMTQAERVGYRVLTPLGRTDGTTVLVDRGWLPLGASRDRLPDVRVGTEPRTITGRVDLLPRPGIVLDTPDGAGWPRVISFPTLGQLERLAGRPLYPQIVLLDPALPDGYVRDWQAPGLPPDRHIGYAVQWYGLALTLLVIYVVVNLKSTDP